ncbi:hypothetical protein [Sporolactobacillus inulinus]|jgi:hypothetical protein|uniref:Uncharacterized protein n=1 Tax=Sporolactobacillus inulinus TaxID=2078 RepID=A0A4Y1ZB56_9BACL|nr:hypothetical protein [Sporolactobacillus inulinus]GAY76312.1 hypothetical protein NBRC111894_1866 [Sporolactobacillus inulinus]
MNRHISVNVARLCSKRSHENTLFDGDARAQLAKFPSSHTLVQHLNRVAVSAVVCCPSS